MQKSAPFCNQVNFTSSLMLNSILSQDEVRLWSKMYAGTKWLPSTYLKMTVETRAGNERDGYNRPLLQHCGHMPYGVSLDSDSKKDMSIEIILTSWLNVSPVFGKQDFMIGLLTLTFTTVRDGEVENQRSQRRCMCGDAGPEEGHCEGMHEVWIWALMAAESTCTSWPSLTYIHLFIFTDSMAPRTHTHAHTHILLSD